MKNKLEIKKLYGIKNKIKLEWNSNKLVVFSPNGVGKTSISKGFKCFAEKKVGVSKEGDMKSNSLIFNSQEIKINYLRTKVIDGEDIEKVMNEDVNIIKDKILKENKNFDNFIIDDELIQEFYDFKINFYDDPNIRKIDNIDLKINFMSRNSVLKNMDEIDGLIKEIESHENKEIDHGVLDIYKENLKIIVRNKKLFKNWANKIAIYKESLKEIIPEYLIADIKLIDEILLKSDSDNFKYQYKGQILSIKKAKEKIDKIMDVNNLSQKQIDAIHLVNWASNEFNKDVGVTVGPLIKVIENSISKIEHQIIYNGLYLHSARFQVAHKKFKEKEKEFVKKYNIAIDEVNATLLKFNYLKIKVKIGHIKNYHSANRILYFNQNDEWNKDEVFRYSSLGQRRILSLILLCCSLKDFDLIIFDDPMSSLDSDNMQIFISIFESFKKEIIILTHSSDFFSMCKSAKFDGFLLDSIDEQNVLNCPMEKWIAPASIFDYKVKDTLKPASLILMGSIVREVIDNYVMKKSNEQSENHYLRKICSIIDSYLRHRKFDERTFEDFFLLIEKEISNISDKTKSNLFILNKFLDYKEKCVGSISGYVLDFKEKNFSNVSEYISIKYMLLLKLRFKIEDNLISYNNRIEWNSDKIFGLKNIVSEKDCEHPLFKLNKKLNYLNHLNNLRLSPIFETPIHKALELSKFINNFKKD